MAPQSRFISLGLIPFATFCALPREIRDMIWEHTHEGAQGAKDLRALMVSKQLYDEEAIMQAWTRTTFSMVHTLETLTLGQPMRGSRPSDGLTGLNALVDHRKAYIQAISIPFSASPNGSAIISSLVISSPITVFT